MKKNSLPSSERLNEISQREWHLVCKQLSEFIARRLGQHTRYGAHSEIRKNAVKRRTITYSNMKKRILIKGWYQ